MREQVLVGQVDSTPDQLAPQKIDTSATERPQKNMRKGKTHTRMHLLLRIFQFPIVVVLLLLQ